ncbi:MAG: serine hydrolase [Candidatus Riflebacteria bacterium]|nr:serine hydrolase [Candidatus Riflebacteria bacterium]
MPHAPLPGTSRSPIRLLVSTGLICLLAAPAAGQLPPSYRSVTGVGHRSPVYSEYLGVRHFRPTPQMQVPVSADGQLPAAYRPVTSVGHRSPSYSESGGVSLGYPATAIPGIPRPDGTVNYTVIGPYGERIAVCPSQAVPPPPYGAFEPAPSTPSPVETPSPEPSPATSPTPAASEPEPAPGPARKVDPSDPDNLPVDPALETLLQGEVDAVADLEAGIVLLDHQGLRRASVNPRADIYPSSIIKLVIMVGALKELAAGRLDPDRLCPVQRGPTDGLPEGYDQAPVPELLSRMIGRGDHAASNTLIDLIGSARINEVASSLGLADTQLHRKFNRPASSGAPPNRMAPRDAASVLYRVLRRDLLDPASSRKALDLLSQQPRAEGIPRLISRLPGVLAFDLPGSAQMSDGRELVCDAAIVTGSQHSYVLVIYALARRPKTDWIARTALTVHRWLGRRR